MPTDRDYMKRLHAGVLVDSQADMGMKVPPDNFNPSC